LIRYFKGDPSEHVIKYVKGKVVEEGRGASFFYWSRTASVVAVPTNTVDAEFVFNQITANFQTVIAQGQVTFRIADPKKIASLLNYTIDPVSRRFTSEDSTKLSNRVVNLAQEAIRAEIQRLSLEDNLRKEADMAKAALSALRNNVDLGALGVEVLNVFLNTVRPTPEVAKALEAEYREALLKKADEAIYGRRAVAVEQERIIRENELGTDISLESERARLVELKAANLEKEANAEAKAIEARLAPYRSADPRMVTALGLMAMGENAEKIGNLMITPDLFSDLLRKKSD
jgi:regulator of protease activity HflC (stomatin/prohibitin superfamily)